MSNPKEKALYLIHLFYETTPNMAFIDEPLGILTPFSSRKQAKQCALIAVNEILNMYIKFPKHPQSIYWNEVKQEIDKL